MNNNSYVVFDIETIGVDFDSDLDEGQQEYLLKNTTTDDERKEIKNSLGLSPLTGEIVCIAMYNPESKAGKVFYNTLEQDYDDESQSFSKNNFEYILSSEEEILKNFWKNIKKYKTYITFNGRCFDIPFIIIRSSILEVKNSIELMKHRYKTDQHLDLLDDLSFQGAFKRFSLDFYCRSFNIPTPKKSVSGDKVNEFYKNGKALEVAEYCADDVVATGELFLKWQASKPNKYY